MERYGRILSKRKREIVLLRGSGCIYKRCAFCDYYIDSDKDERANFQLNKEILSRVTGEFGDLEIINSGSVFELDKDTLSLIKDIAYEKHIKTLHFEAHYLYRGRIEELRNYFSDFDLKMKLGLETFDRELRENYLKKGIPEDNPEIISHSFDEANFLFGISGQSVSSMEKDIELGLKYFERICINLMCENSAPVKPDKSVINDFMNGIYPEYADDYRVDILINNTDFGVGD